MSRAIRTLLVTPAAASALLWCALPDVQAQSPTISGYQKVSETRMTRSVTEFTYRATLTNTGQALSAATATVTSLSPATTVVQGIVTFGPIASNATASSLDTFTFRHDRTVPFDWSLLQWTISPDSANRPPVAHAGPDQTVAAGTAVQLDGSGSSDADGDALTFAWSFEAVPQGSAATLNDPAAVNPSFTADLRGTYVLRLTVNDGSADSAPDSVSITTENSAPVANAGPDQTRFFGETVTLDGSGSSDVDGDPLTFSWTFISRPAGSAAVLDDASDAQPTFAIDATGSYEIQLVVHDGTASSAPDTVAITTGNSRPIADAGPDRAVSVTEAVTLDGSGSSDVNGDPLTFSWSFTASPVGSTATLPSPASAMPSFVPDLPGTYVAQLIVNDGLENSDPDTVTVTADMPEVTLAAADPDAAEAGSDPGTLTFTRTGSTLNPLTIDYTIDGSATNGADYDAIGTSITIPAGSAWADLIVLPVDDGTFELPESVIVTLSPGTAYIVGTTGPVNVAIQDNDANVGVTVSDNDASEAGPDSGTFAVSRLGPTTGDLVVFYAMAGTATQGLDYEALAGTVTIPAGSSTAIVTVTPIDDALFEGPETAILVLGPHASYSIGLGQASVTITDDERPAVTIVPTDDTAAEAGTAPATFTIARTGPTTAPLTVSYDILGSAGNGADYATISATATIPPGSATVTVTITPIDDPIFEESESVILALNAGPDYAVVTPGLAAITILDNDGAQVTIVATDPTASEAGDTGIFTIARTGGNLTQQLLVQVARSGTASDGRDYADLGGVNFFVTIPANELSATVTITPFADAIVEGDETVTLTIVPLASYVIGTPGSATVTIAGP